MGGGSDNCNQRDVRSKKSHTKTFQALFLRKVVFTFYIIGI